MPTVYLTLAEKCAHRASNFPICARFDSSHRVTRLFFSLSLSPPAMPRMELRWPFTKKASTITGREGRSVVISFSIEFRFLLYFKNKKIVITNEFLTSINFREN